MKKLILGTVAVVALGLGTPASAEDHGHAATETTPAAAATAMEAAPAAEAVKEATKEAAVTATVVDVAIANPDFSTLVSALSAAELTEALKAEGPFTVFAPTNAAFQKLDPAVLADLLKPENKAKLQAVLKHHVVAGKVAGADAKGAAVDLTTLGGDVLKVDGTGEAVKIGEATVTSGDIVAANGVVHVIDTVLIPADAPKEPSKTE